MIASVDSHGQSIAQQCLQNGRPTSDAIKSAAKFDGDDKIAAKTTIHFYLIAITYQTFSLLHLLTASVRLTAKASPPLSVEWALAAMSPATREGGTFTVDLGYLGITGAHDSDAPDTIFPLSALHIHRLKGWLGWRQPEAGGLC